VPAASNGVQAGREATCSCVALHTRRSEEGVTQGFTRVSFSVDERRTSQAWGGAVGICFNPCNEKEW